MESPQTAYVGLGSNVGDREAHLAAAIAGLGTLPLTSVTAVSPVIETAAVGPVPQAPYLNAVVGIETRLEPRALLARLHAIERARGRDRSASVRWGPRTLDLDILLYADLVVDEPGLSIPHPRMHERLFVLTPLSKIAGGVQIPTLGMTVAHALERAAAIEPGARL